MNSNSQAFILAIETHGQHIETVTQYGVRYPDGGVRWESEPKELEGPRYLHNFERIVTVPDKIAEYDRTLGRNVTYKDAWDTLLTRRAEAANLDPEDYAEGHEFVKRTIILTVMDCEEVSG